MDICVKELPDNCGKCWIIGVNEHCIWCPLLLDKHNDCVEIYDLLARLPNCPLKVIEQWRLESCETCLFHEFPDMEHPPENRVMCRLYGLKDKDDTCKKWEHEYVWSDEADAMVPYDEAKDGTTKEL